MMNSSSIGFGSVFELAIYFFFDSSSFLFLIPS